MKRVELIYDADCPNVHLARKALLEGFSLANLTPSWTEWDRDLPGSPLYARDYGSPTILVDGRDVAGARPGKGEACCRLYGVGPEAFAGAPAAGVVAEALRRSDGPSASATRPVLGLRSSLATVPGIAFAFLPNLACPACWPAYSGLLGSLGLGFLVDTAYLFPLTMVFLLVAVGSLAFRAQRRRGYGPFVGGLAAAVVLLAGKFALESDVVMYSGIGLLVAASLWNAWPAKMNVPGSCPACDEVELEMETRKV